MDRLNLHLRRIVRHRRLVHQGKFNGFPVVGIPLFRRISSQLIFPELPQEMQIVAVEDDLHIGMLCNVIYVLCGNVGPVQIGCRNLVPIFIQPVPDARHILLAVEDLDSHLLQSRGIRLLMKVIVP